MIIKIPKRPLWLDIYEWSPSGSCSTISLFYLKKIPLFLLMRHTSVFFNPRTTQGTTVVKRVSIVSVYWILSSHAFSQIEAQKIKIISERYKKLWSPSSGFSESNVGRWYQLWFISNSIIERVSSFSSKMTKNHLIWFI